MAHILLIDDEKVARTLYSDFLIGAGHSVKAVSDSAEARTELGKEKFDLVVTDLILPNGDGMEVLRYVKNHHPLTEVLVITALDKVDPAVRAIKSGASDYLVKPVNPEVLAHAVNRAMTTRGLLTENRQLREHVDLMETGNRIATTLEKPRLAATSCEAFARTCEARVAVLLMREGETYVVQGAHGLDEAKVEAMKEPLSKAVTRAMATVPAEGAKLSMDLPGRIETAFIIPATDNKRAFGAMVLMYEGDAPAETGSRAQSLARHLGLALRNLGKFAEVEDLVYLDDLTHLFNHRYMQQVLDKELKVATTTQGAKPFTVLFMDLDYFKSVNDTHGHAVGSKLLVEVGRVVKGCVRDNDVVARWGGDEYVILLRGTDSGGALKVAERIRRSIEGHHFLAREGFGLSITTSIGMASYPEHAQTKQDLVDFSDRAMYRGKKGSRNIIYMAAKGLDPTPASRHNTQPPADAAKK
jgi:two-component system, cell cycle response regulator